MWITLLSIWFGLGFLSFLYYLEIDIRKKEKIIITEYVILFIITLFLGGVIFIENCKKILKNY